MDLPRLQKRSLGNGINVLTDEDLFRAQGRRIAFAGRSGGVSRAPFDSLDTCHYIDDDLTDVLENRHLLLVALGGEGEVLCPRQVHGDFVAQVDAGTDLALLQEQIQEGCDGILVREGAGSVPVLLNFADCVPVILVSEGDYAVVHAGWRGVMNRIAPSTLQRMHAPVNIYLGPHIGACCFQVSLDLRQRFAQEFGEGCLVGEDRVSLEQALRVSLVQAGAEEERICSAGVCTVCHSDEWFSYRATGGACGRHAALAF